MKLIILMKKKQKLKKLFSIQLLEKKLMKFPFMIIL